jgi:hypothetical protein
VGCNFYFVSFSQEITEETRLDSCRDEDENELFDKCANKDLFPFLEYSMELYLFYNEDNKDTTTGGFWLSDDILG